MRGDRPTFDEVGPEIQRFTPHARGSTAVCGFGRLQDRVYPACAGIDLILPRVIHLRFCLPRMRGDRPLVAPDIPTRELFTPHARGSTLAVFCHPGPGRVYPACAGIDRLGLLTGALTTSLPRMRGDRPILDQRLPDFGAFTPHARGSTGSSFSSLSCAAVYPACAGIDPGWMRS